jgi:hypothetical protein
MCPSYKKTHAQSGIGLSRLLTEVLISPAQTLLHRLSKTMKRVFPSIKVGLTLPLGSAVTRLPSPTAPLFSRSVLIARKHYTTSIVTKTTSQTRPTSSSASLSTIVKAVDNPTIAKQQQLPRDSEFECRVKQFLGDFTRVEQSIALNLPMEDRLRLGPPNQSSSFIATNYSFNMEILATLAGLKPCTLFHSPGRGSGQNTTPIFDRFVWTAVLPRFQQCNFDRYGFALFRVPHHIRIEETGEDWHNCWVLADCRSENWGRAKSIFLAAQDQRYRMPTVGYALGYPVLSALWGYETRYIYVDMTATYELAERTRSNVRRVIGVEYYASPISHQMEESRENFERYRQLGQKYGREYVFQYETNPSPEREGTPTQVRQALCVED